MWIQSSYFRSFNRVSFIFYFAEILFRWLGFSMHFNQIMNNIFKRRGNKFLNYCCLNSSIISFVVYNFTFRKVPSKTKVERSTHTPPNISTRSIWVCFCVRRREKIDSNLPKIEKWWVDGAMQPNYKLLQPIRSVSFLSFFDFLLLSSVRFSSPCVWCVVRYIGCYFLHIFRHLFMWLSLFVSCWRLSDLIRRNHS